MRRRADDGMTLIELVVSIAIIGLLATVIGAAITVTFRQQEGTEARVHVARWEQSLGLWLPPDLSSADASLPNGFSDDPTVSPCASADCTFGSNALQLAWADGLTPPTTTVVGYRFGLAADGVSSELRRVECIGATCTSRVVLRDLARPPISWTPGTSQVPADIMDVDTSARHVDVTVNGAHGPENSRTVSLAGSGVTTAMLPTATIDRPTFADALSTCGGPITLVVDQSGSVGGANAEIQAGVRSFVEALSGTPTDLKIIRMYARAETLGGGWEHVYDLSDPAQVGELLDPGGDIEKLEAQPVGPIGETNWEDALFRTFNAESGAALPASQHPELLVFFTDGVPTRHRLSPAQPPVTFFTGPAPGPAAPPEPYNIDGNVSATRFHPTAWYRAWSLLEARRGSTRVIGVGVGTRFGDSSNFDQTDPIQQQWPPSVENIVMLGELVTLGEGNPHEHVDPYDFEVETYSGAWGDVSDADVLTTNDFSKLSSALTQIAFGSCGGSLTVQTQLAGAPAPSPVTYAVPALSQSVTTNQLARTGTFDLTTGVAVTVTLDPVDLGGYSPTGWSCRSKGADHGSYSQVSSNPADGVNVTVSGNDVISCTMTVT